MWYVMSEACNWFICFFEMWTWCQGYWVYCIDTLFTITQTHTFLCSSYCSLPWSVLRESTLLNWIPQPIDYCNGSPRYTVGYCMSAPHQDHRASRDENGSLHSPSLCPEHCVLAVHASFLQTLNIYNSIMLASSTSLKNVFSNLLYKDAGFYISADITDTQYYTWSLQK